MTSAPRISIGLPVFNGESYMAQALDSVLGQTFTDIEVVISDNASTDATPEIGRSYARRDARVRYTRLDVNVGAGPNFNRVFKLARAPFFKWMAHDDMLEPTWAQRCIEILEAEPATVLAHTAIHLVDEAGRSLPMRSDGKVIDGAGRRHHDREPPHLAEGGSPSARFAEVLRRMNWCTAVFGLIRAEALRRTHLHGSYYEADRVLLAELALHGRFRQLDEPLFIKRCHGGVSVLKPFREQARMIDPALAPGPPGYRLRAGYFRSLMVGKVGVVERAACALTVARVSLRNPLTRRLLVALRGQQAAGLPPQERRA